jgi:ketosteroid isomerase-like protein
MSKNLDLVRSIFAAWERGDFGSVEWAHPEIEFVIADGPSPTTATGVAGMATAWREVSNAWKEVRVQADEYRELDGDRVLVLVRRSGSGKRSGLDVRGMRTQGANLFHVGDGKVTRFVLYWDIDGALADLGLQE